MDTSSTTASNGFVAAHKTITRKPGQLCLKTAIALQEGAKTASSPESAQSPAMTIPAAPPGGYYAVPAHGIMYQYALYYIPISYLY